MEKIHGEGREKGRKGGRGRKGRRERQRRGGGDFCGRQEGGLGGCCLPPHLCLSGDPCPLLLSMELGGPGGWPGRAKSVSPLLLSPDQSRGSEMNPGLGDAPHRGERSHCAPAHARRAAPGPDCEHQEAKSSSGLAPSTWPWVLGPAMQRTQGGRRSRCVQMGRRAWCGGTSGILPLLQPDPHMRVCVGVCGCEREGERETAAPPPLQTLLSPSWPRPHRIPSRLVPPPWPRPHLGSLRPRPLLHHALLPPLTPTQSSPAPVSSCNYS